MLTPEGFRAKDMDPAMLLNIWAHTIASEDREMIFAGLGKPSYPLNFDFAQKALQYWQDLSSRIPDESTAIDYGTPSGTIEAKKTMAQALSHWYENEGFIEDRDLIFTVGGSSALRMIFQIFKCLKRKIITTSPYYPFYNNRRHENRFHFINLLDQNGCRLTASLLKKSIEEVGEKNINAFLFCDPNNPLGCVIGEEWKKIAAVLCQTPEEIPIIVDEAYAELTFGSKHVSLLKVAPELKKRLIILRSATKGFSASGERIAVILCFNPKWRDDLVRETIFSYGHAPKSMQIAYAQAMLAFTEEKRAALSNYYQKQVEFVLHRLQEMNVQVPNLNKIEGGFYVLANLSPLLGQEIPDQAKRALGHGGKVETDLELCYSLLFKDQMMVCPFSFFGGDPALGIVRITCSGGIHKMAELMDRLQEKLVNNEWRGCYGCC